MEDIKSLVVEYLHKINGSIKISNCWNHNQLICEILF